jgi:hypothetical protein
MMSKVLVLAYFTTIIMLAITHVDLITKENCPCHHHMYKENCKVKPLTIESLPCG